VVSRVLVDTSALSALLDGDDPRHPAAVTALASLRDVELVTHGYVVAESIAVTRRRFGWAGVRTLIDDLLPIMATVAVDAELHAQALGAYRGAQPSSVSFVDRVSLDLIQREGIEMVFALDPDLASPGVTLLPRD
jgi:predicted nucleic acid-binding protein